MKPTTVAYRRSGHLKTLAAAQQDMYWDTMRCSQCNFLLGSLHKTNTHTWAQTWKQPLSDPLSLEASSCQMSSNVHFSVKKHRPACWTLMQLSEHLPPHVEKQSALVALDPVGTSIVQNRRNCRQLSAVNLIFPRMPEPGATTKRKNWMNWNHNT